MSDLVSLLLHSMRWPKRTARQLYEQRPSAKAIWIGAALASCISVLVTWGGQLAMFPGEEMTRLMAQVSPLIFAALTVVVLIIMAFAFHQTSRVLGGTGRFVDTLLAVCWVQAVLAIAQVAIFMLAVVVPVAAGLLGLAAFVWSLIAFVQFLRAAHGFASTGRAIGAALMGLALLAFAWSTLANLILNTGVTVSGL